MEKKLVDKKYELDERTKKYFKTIEETSGFLTIIINSEQEKLLSKEEVMVWKGEDPVEIGKTTGGLWCVQFSEQNQTQFVKMYFTQRPFPDTIKIIDSMYKVRFWKKFYGIDLEFNCVKCGERLHWLDSFGDFVMRVENLLNKNCGNHLYQKEE